MAKKRAEAKIVFVLFLLVELLIIALVAMKGKYKQLEIEPWQLMAIGGGFLVIYVFYLKFRTQTVEQHVVDEKVKTSVLIEALPGGVVVLDEEGLVVSVNQKAAAAFAVDPLALLGKPFAEAVAGEVAEKVRQGYCGRVGPVGGRMVDITPLPQGKGKLIVVGDEAKGAATASPWGRPLRENVDLKATVRGFLTREEATIKARKLDIALEEKGAGSVVRGDPSLLRRAVAELLGNAMRFTADGGRIVVSLDGGGDGVDLRIRDAGVGIRQESLPGIFEKGADGGLGLFLAKGIIESHGGTIWVESREGQGTLVTANLPK